MSDFDRLLAPGDRLQSAASRMAEWIQTHEFEDVPYEVAMAALEAQSAVEDWTEARVRNGWTP